MIKTVVVLSATLLFMLSFNFQCNLLKLVIKMPNLGNNASIKYQNFTEDNRQKLFGKLPSFYFLYLQYLRDIYLVFPFIKLHLFSLCIELQQTHTIFGCGCLGNKTTDDFYFVTPGSDLFFWQNNVQTSSDTFLKV